MEKLRKLVVSYHTIDERKQLFSATFVLSISKPIRGIGKPKPTLKRDAGNPILNTLSEAAFAIFSACKKPTAICLQP